MAQQNDYGYGSYPKIEGLGNQISTGIEALLNGKNPFNPEKYQWSKIVDYATDHPSNSYIPQQSTEGIFTTIVMIVLVFLGIHIILK